MRCQYSEEVIKYHECELSLEKSREIERHLESCAECKKMLSLISLSKKIISKEIAVNVDFYSRISSKIDSGRYKEKKINLKILRIAYKAKHVLKPVVALAAVLVLAVLLKNYGMQYIENFNKGGRSAGLQISRPHTGTSSWEIVNRMSKGINLGNTLESPNEGDWAMEAKEYYFDDFKKAGFSNVRIPVRWDEHMGKEYPYTIDPAWLDRVEQVIDWSLSRGLVTIVDSQHDDWINENYSKNFGRFEKLWEQVSDRLKDKSENLIFEICNEPSGNITNDEINDMNKRILAKIRIKNPTRCVVIGGGNWYSYKMLINNVDIPADPHIIATFHYYEPDSFAHQNQGKWGSVEDKQVVRAAFDEINDWSSHKKVPVLLGEFGVAASADKESRIKYYDYITDEALAHGFAFSVWDNGIFGFSENDMALYKRSTREFDQSILNAVIDVPVMQSVAPSPSATP